jgi:hypothetical protein
LRLFSLAEKTTNSLVVSDCRRAALFIIDHSHRPPCGSAAHPYETLQSRCLPLLRLRRACTRFTIWT